MTIDQENAAPAWGSEGGKSIGKIVRTCRQPCSGLPPSIYRDIGISASGSECAWATSAHTTNSGGAMPVPTPDPSGASTPTTPLYVWESLRQPGDYALCTDPQHGDFQNSNWRFRGELATVPELDGFPRPSIANGWPMRVHRDRPPSGG